MRHISPISWTKKLLGTNAQIRVWSNEDNAYFYKILTLRQYVSFAVRVFLLYRDHLCFSISVSSVKLPEFLNGDKKALVNIAIVVGVFFTIHYLTLTLYAITFLFDKINKIREG
jgi:hypothetical protein